MSIGQNTWVIPEGYIPGQSNGPEPEMESHDTLSILNTNDEVAHLEITIYFTDRDPVGPYRYEVPGRRTEHLRLNSLSDPEPVPHDTDYASVVQSDIPVVVQYTRLDSRQAENAIMSTVAYPHGG